MQYVPGILIRLDILKKTDALNVDDRLDISFSVRTLLRSFQIFISHFQAGTDVLISDYNVIVENIHQRYFYYRKDTESSYHSFMYSLVSIFFPESIHYLQFIHCLLH